MKRRDFLRNMAVAPLLSRTCISGGSLLAGMKNAYAANGKTLIVIFQRGGCDGLNTVVPYGEDEYYNLRPNIAISPPGSGANSALNLNGFFGFHPAMTGLYNIFQQGDLAVLPTVHYNNANRSHFSSQDFIESGVPNQSLLDGWLNRYISSVQRESELRSVSFGTLAHSLKGSQPIVTVNNLASIKEDDNAHRDVLQRIYQNVPANANQSRSLVSQHGTLALDNISILEQFSNTNYTVENGAVYPNSNFGQQLKDVAQLIKSGIGLEVATVSSKGWDHHSNQGGAQGTQANRLTEFSSGIEALYKDLGSYMNDVVMLTVSEFGRTAKQNASLGTDHGNAASWFVIGRQVNGGIYGDWPGLLPEQLYKGRYLAHTVNFSDVFAEVISRHLGASESLSAALPGSQYQPIGFLT